MNKSAKYLLDCGHIQNIQVGTSTPHTLVRASCLPEMKHDCVCKVLLLLDIVTVPYASCKHVGAVCYALVEFCKSGKLPDSLTCTQWLQEWKKSRPRKVEQ